MGNAFIIRRGGSGGMKEPFAMIYAHFLSGATVTCSNGSTTLTAPAGVQTDYCFLLPNAGTWTVTAAIGGVTTSKTVSVTAQYQAAYVNLGKVYLLKRGTPGAGIEFSLSHWTTAYPPPQAVNITENGIEFPFANRAVGGSAQITDKIDFGTTPRFSKLCAMFTSVGSVFGGAYKKAVGISDSIYSGLKTDMWSGGQYSPNPYFNIYVVDAGGAGASAVTLEVDVSTVTGEHYVGVAAKNEVVTCTDIWLE